jgi:hypothetical protein
MKEVSEAKNFNQAKIEIFNTPIFVMPEPSPTEKPDPENIDTGSGFLALIEIILEIIAATAEAIAGHEKK